MTRINPCWAIALALTAATWGASAIVYPHLPATIPTHWNLHGEVDGYGSKASTTFLMPAFMIGMLVFYRVLPTLCPKDYEVDSFRPTLLFLMVVVTGLFAYIQGVILLATWQQVSKAAHPIDIGRTIFTGMFLFLGLIGSVLGKVRRNFYVGVRVPWALASDRVWNDTHRLAAWSLVAGSLVGFVVTASGLPLAWAFAALTVSVVIPVIYSFVRYKQLERRGTL
ncbi:MAG: DUF1648 domain-containing protein [Planctomycetia bacterium]|nr:DUF1648 domain-containing protein [Planctomycetia bacterium]